MVARTRGVPSPRKLKFREKLVTKPPLTTDVLLKRIKALHTELADMDQELVEVSSLDGVRKELISHTILLHKDKGVKAFAACCTADLLRLYAPDAPFTQDELTDIFQFFIRQLVGNLKSTDTPYYNQYFHLLESLSTVKSVVLVCDLPKSDDLVEQFFKDFFKLVRFDLSKKIELFMADILVAIVDECQSIPSGVLTTLLAQFMDTQLVSSSFHLSEAFPNVCRSRAWNNRRIDSLYKSAIPLLPNCNEMSANTSLTSSFNILRMKTSTRFTKPTT
jgi:sister-chromatid-cohesion protein PDS5